MTHEMQNNPPRKKYKQTSLLDSFIGVGIAKKSGLLLNMQESNSSMEELKQGTVSDCTVPYSSNHQGGTAEVLVSYEYKFYQVIQSKHTNRTCWRGKPLLEMQNILNNHYTNELVKVEQNKTHTVLITEKPNKEENQGVLSSIIYVDKWDSQHVKMPCSPCSQCPVHQNGNSTLEERWILIGKAFSQKINTSLELEKAILSYNNHYSNVWNFQGLHAFIERVLSIEERSKFFDYTLPGIIQLALKVPEKLPEPPLLLVAQKQQSLSMTQSQIASLLANAFLSTFPRRNTQKKNSEFSKYPDINFVKLFENKSNATHVYEKMKCIVHYFNRVIETEPMGVVTFTRKVISNANFPDWNHSKVLLSDLHVSSEGTIEKEGSGFLQMDFANRFIGGGVLNWGCVQEEIRFIVCPELIIACLFSEVMDSNEALIITGCEKYCKHSGYSSSFRFEGDFRDTTPRDQYGRRLCQVVAIDATSYRRKEFQYLEEHFRRELNKAFVGFFCDQKNVALTAVATGNWGCGAFHGDPRLKSLLQLMAASIAGRDIIYFTFGDDRLRDDIFSMYSLLKEKNVNVGDLYHMLRKYGEQLESASPALDLYGYLFANLDSIESDNESILNDDASRQLPDSESSS